MLHYSYWNKKIVDSPRGAGEVESVSHAGFPSVNGVTVAWAEFEDGYIFDPYNVREEFIKKRVDEKK